jgi:hypothetical protein
LEFVFLKSNHQLLWILGDGFLPQVDEFMTKAGSAVVGACRNFSCYRSDDKSKITQWLLFFISKSGIGEVFCFQGHDSPGMSRLSDVRCPIAIATQSVPKIEHATIQTSFSLCLSLPAKEIVNC